MPAGAGDPAAAASRRPTAMTILPRLAAALLLLGGSHSLVAADQPNILWITSEDNGAHWLGCYGNAEARTPRLDALAAEGLRFTSAYANAAVCAVARSTILNGAYAVTQGTQHMRSRHPIPAEFKSYVSYLRQAGYHCTNNAKTDYNFKGNDRAIWDACSDQAHYRDRPAGKPFFAIFNLTVSHESSLFPATIRANRQRGVIPGSPRLDPAALTVPPYLPDLPEIRSDIAIYHDIITALDTRVGRILDELEADGLAADTIVFYYADHAGITPRGKRYLEDTGTRVPLLVHIPEKWRALAPFAPGSAVDEPVSFVDLAPTVLSLAGIAAPGQMQGRAFLGTNRRNPRDGEMVFLFADRFDEIYGMRRGLTDGRWKYIRRFTPHLPAAPYSYYQFGQAGWTAWRQAWQDGALPPRFKRIWEAPQETEQLFDTASDPWEIRNLAGDPAHAGRLAAMRDRLRATMIAAADTGIIPEPMFKELAPGKPVATWLAAHKAALPALVDLAFRATARNPEELPLLLSKLASGDPLERYWATQGCLILGTRAETAADALAALLDDPHAAIRASAAHALWAAGRKEQASTALVRELDAAGNEHARMLVANILTWTGELDQIPDEWVEKTRANKQAGEYLLRLADRLHQERRAGKAGAP